MNFFGVVSASSPAWLLSLPVVLGTLIYIYRKRGSGKRITVASTFILKQLPQEKKARKNFFPPLRFFFELLILFSLITILAGLKPISENLNIAMVVDNSFHTFAKTSSGDRLSDIKDRASATISVLPANSRISLFSSAPELRPVGEANLSKGAALNLLKSIQSKYGSSDFQSNADAVSLITDIDKLLIISDATTNNNGAENKALDYHQARNYESIKSQNNIAIRSAKWIDTDQSQRVAGPKIIVSLVSFSMHETSVAVKARCSPESDLPLKEVATQRLKIASGATKDITIQGISSSDSLCKVWLEVNNDVQNNVITEDDLIWLVAEKQSNNILLVSPFTVTELNLAAIDGYKFKRVTPESYHKGKFDKELELALFHRYSPDSLPEMSSILVIPEQKSAIIEKVQSDVSSITSWEESHPLLRYVDFSAISISKASTFKPSIMFNSLVSGPKGALMLAAEKRNKRYVVSGFELLPFDGSKSPTASILILNMLKWIASSQALSESLLINQTMQNLGKQSFQYYEQDIIASNDDTFTADKPGIVIRKKENISDLISIQYFSAAESDLRSTPKINLPAFKATERGTESGSTYNWLILLCLIVLSLDMIVSLYRGLKR